MPAEAAPSPADIGGAALEAWLEAQVPGLTPPVSIVKFPGGQSNPTYRLSDTPHDLVLRRKPFGTLLSSAHMIEREYQVISALYPTGFPVARPMGLCEDLSVIGAAFYVMGYVEGEVHWDGTLPCLSPERRRAVYLAMIDTLAALHRLDPEGIGLKDYGKPGNYFARQIERWTRQYRAAQTDDMPAVEALIDWLPRTVPSQTRLSVVHGDYRIDNLIFETGGSRVCAVLDWELSTLGDPMADFTYLMMNWHMPCDGRAGLAGADLDALGIPSLGEAVTRYCTATGMAPPSDLNWYFAYNLFRLTGIVQGIKKRLIDGNAASKRAADMAALVGPLSDMAWHHAQLSQQKQ